MHLIATLKLFIILNFKINYIISILIPQPNISPNVYDGSIKLPITNKFEIVNEWKYLDFEFPSYQRRLEAIAKNQYIPENNLPLGIDVEMNRIFITTPRWKDGVPASLGVVSNPQRELSPLIQPYPNLDEHGDPYNPDCNKLISVYRTQIDECNRLWAIDAGIVNATSELNQICPPKIVAYDLRTDKRVVSYDIPPEQVKQESLHSNIIVDIRNKNCGDAYAYVPDVWRFGIVVYSLKQNRSWRATNHFFYPLPEASDFNVYGLNFEWMDGAFGLTLSPLNEYNDRLLFFHPMASFKEFMMSTSILRDESLWIPGGATAPKSVVEVGDRGPQGQSSTSGFDRNQIMFFTLVHQDAVGCWDSRKPYKPSNIGVIGHNDSGIVFPNDIKIDNEFDQNVWIISNKLPVFLYSKLNFSEINFRILKANIRDATDGTQCDPNIQSIGIPPENEGFS